MILHGIEYQSYLKICAYWPICDLLIFGIPEVNFLVRAFQFGMKGVLSRIYDISPGFNICIFPKFFTCLLINPHRQSMSEW